MVRPRRCAPSFVGLFVLLMGSAAAAQGSAPEPLRVTLLGGYSLLALSQVQGQIPATVNGWAPGPHTLEADARFGTTPFGFGGAGTYARFSASGADFSGRPSTLVFNTFGAHAGVTAARRFTSFFGLRGLLGYGVGSEPVVDGATAQVNAGNLVQHGPFALVMADLHVGEVLTLGAGVTATPASLGATLNGLDVGTFRQLALRAELSAGRFTLPVGRLTFTGRYERTFAGSTGALNLERDGHTFGLGVRFSLPPTAAAIAAAAAAEPPPPAPRFAVSGRVLYENGAPAPGVRVTVGALAAQTGPDGSWRVEELLEGSYPLAAVSEGYLPAQEILAVGPDAPARLLELKLVPDVGPGKVRGVVYSGDPSAPQSRKPLVGATVVTADGKTATADANGAFLLEGVGPGVVQLTVTAAEHKQRVELVSVPSRAEAQVDVYVLPAAARPLASVRGIIRSAKGKKKIADAEVVIPEAKVRELVGGDGKFQIRLPGGTYSVIVQADGFVTQKRSVVLKDGEHAIFHIDLKPSR